jgi:hypothetical protein
MAVHDIGYKYLFAHPELVQELLADFTAFGWLGAIDARAWERVNPAYVSERFSERHDDIVWRVRVGGHWLYVYLLLEFQSGVDRWMALRMQVYVGLLYQDLVKRKELGPGDLLPPVLPLVFYNGAAAWTAPTELGAAIVPGPDQLVPFQAQQRYVLVDQRRLDPATLADKRGVLAMLFRLELSELPQVVLEILPLLGAWLRHDDQAPLQRSVAAWVEQVLLRQFNDPGLVALLDANKEAAMGRKFETWYEYVEDQGMQKGIQKGIERGMQEASAHASDAMRRALTHILDKRFGEDAGLIVPRLERASVDELAQWLERAVDTPSLQALLANGGPDAGRQ